MATLLYLLLIIHYATSDLHDPYSSPYRFNLRKLLEENVGNSSNSTNSTAPSAGTPVQVHPLAILQVVDDLGLVVDEVTTNQNIRLKVKALTSPEYQAPFVSRCWYNKYDDKPRKSSEPSNFATLLEKGCAVQYNGLLEMDVIPFEENGLLEVQTHLFNLMTLYDYKFSFLDIHCAVTLCQVEADCLVACTKRQNTWKMDRDAVDFEISTTVLVEKQKPTTKATTAAEKQDLNEFLISGGKKPAAQGIISQTEAPFLKKYQHYFTVSTLGVVVILLLCVIGIGFMFISYKNNKEGDDTLKENPTADLLTGYENKLTGLGNNREQHVPSPPPEYTQPSAWPGGDFNTSAPYRDGPTPSEAALMESRRLQRHSLSPPRIQNPVQRRLSHEGAISGYESGAGRSGRSLPSSWSETADRYREPTDISTSPVGGDLYPVPISRSRSPQSEPLIQRSPPFRDQRRTTSLISMALKEYFDKYGM